MYVYIHEMSIHIYLPCFVFRRFETADIPATDEGMSEWLINLYQEKDELVDHYIKHKRFPDHVKKVNLPRRYWPDLIVFMWISLLGVPAFFTALYLAWMGAWLTLSVIVVAVFVADRLFQYLANETNTKKSSSEYGRKQLRTDPSNTQSEEKKEQ